MMRAGVNLNGIDIFMCTLAAHHEQNFDTNRFTEILIYSLGAAAERTRYY